jgi:hypothetical protein
MDVFYLNVHHRAPPPPGSLPPNVACCSSPDAGLFGYQQIVTGVRELHARHFGDCQWLAELCAAGQEEAGAGEGERDAIEDLQSVVRSLQVEPAAAAAPGAGADADPGGGAPATDED